MSAPRATTITDASPLPRLTARRWFGTGRSTAPDARSAGAEAAAAALDGRRAALLVVFCPATIDHHAMLDGIRAEAGDVPLIGCTGTVQSTGHGPVEAAVVVSALGGDGFEVRTRAAVDTSGRRRSAGEEVAELVETLTSEHKVLVVLSDGLAGEQHDLVRGAYTVLGATVPLVGGCAADDLTYTQTVQFCTDADGTYVLTDAVVAAAIGSDSPMGIGVAHGWRKVGDSMVVTRSQGGRVYEIDGESALDVFLRRTGGPRSLVNDTAAFSDFAVNFPLGMSRRTGDDIRMIHGADPADGSILCLADVPQGALIWMMETDEAGLLASADDACASAIAGLGTAAPLGFLNFDCAVRYTFLGPEGTNREAATFARRAGDVPVAALYTYGEFARTHTARGMHHLTLVTLAFS